MEIKHINLIDDIEIKDVDEKKRIIWHKISKEMPDRMGDVVRVNGGDFKDYKKNPIVLYGHDYRSKDPLPVVGKNVGFKTEGKTLYAGTQFMDPNSDEMSQKWADLVNDLWLLNKKGLMGWSIGFIPDHKETDEMKDKDGNFVGYDFKRWTLYEYSNVIIPANQGAVNNMLEAGELRAKSFFDLAVDLRGKSADVDPETLSIGTVEDEVKDELPVIIEPDEPEVKVADDEGDGWELIESGEMTTEGQLITTWEKCDGDFTSRMTMVTPFEVMGIEPITPEPETKDEDNEAEEISADVIERINALLEHRKTVRAELSKISRSKTHESE